MKVNLLEVSSVFLLSRVGGGVQHYFSVAQYCDREGFTFYICFEIAIPGRRRFYLHKREVMASTINGTLSNTPSYSKDIDTSDLRSRVLFSFGMGLCIAVLSCIVFMFCSRRFDLFITSRLTRNRIYVVQYMDERCSSHISELETWTDTDCGLREDTDTIVPSLSEGDVSLMKSLPIVHKYSIS
jgi:hypothetical protein